jgi:miniconductance mechanosensitive channel
VAWTQYEAIQSDIFDHLLAILPEFGLRVFQHPSGADMREGYGSVSQLFSRPIPEPLQPGDNRNESQSRHG